MSVVEKTKDMQKQLKSLSQFQAVANKKYGARTVMVGSTDTIADIARIKSGSPDIDNILGGGLPTGRIIEISGPEASGKSTICYTTIAEAQKLNKVVGYVDVEHALSREYLSSMGVNLDAIALSQPDTAEEALSLVEDMIDSGIFDIVVVDSVAALTTKKEMEGEMGESHVALLARLMTQALRKINAKVNRTKTTLIFINQLRSNIGAMGMAPKTITPGGHALKFYASVRLDVRRIQAVKDGENVIGQKMLVKTLKNKTSMPFKFTEVTLIYGKGFDQISGVLEDSILRQVITRKGGGHFLNGERIAKSRKEMLALMESDKDLLKKLEELNASTPIPDPDADAAEAGDKEGDEKEAS